MNACCSLMGLLRSRGFILGAGFLGAFGVFLISVLATPWRDSAPTESAGMDTPCLGFHATDGRRNSDLDLETDLRREGFSFSDGTFSNCPAVRSREDTALSEPPLQ